MSPTNFQFVAVIFIIRTQRLLEWDGDALR
jgi:hypothetical protein